MSAGYMYAFDPEDEPLPLPLDLPEIPEPLPELPEFLDLEALPEIPPAFDGDVEQWLKDLFGEPGELS